MCFKLMSCLFLLVLLFGCRASEDEKQIGSNSEELGTIFVGTVFGTKWCGPGNIANDYNDLGSNKEVDRCCRDHDHCPRQIKSGERMHLIYNDSPFTMSTCQCDRDLELCLDRARSLSSYEISTIYTLFSPKCFHIIEIPCTFLFVRCSRHSEDGEQYSTTLLIAENNFTDLNVIYNVKSSTTPVQMLSTTPAPTMSEMVKEQNNNIPDDVEEYNEVVRQPSPPQLYPQTIQPYPSPPQFYPSSPQFYASSPQLYHWLLSPRYNAPSPPQQVYLETCCIEDLQRI